MVPANGLNGHENCLIHDWACYRRFPNSARAITIL
jgi:hypothetical protein